MNAYRDDGLDVSWGKSGPYMKVTVYDPETHRFLSAHIPEVQLEVAVNPQELIDAAVGYLRGAIIRMREIK